MSAWKKMHTLNTPIINIGLHVFSTLWWYLRVCDVGLAEDPMFWRNTHYI